MSNATPNGVHHLARERCWPSFMRLTSRAPVHAFVRRLGIFGSSLFFSFPSLFPEFWLFTTYLLICPIRCYILPEPTFSFLLYY